MWRETRCGLASPAFDLKATTSLCSIRGGWDSNLGTGYKKQLVQLYSIRCKTFRVLTSAASFNYLTNQRRPRSTVPDCHDYRLCDYLFCCPSVQYLTRALLSHLASRTILLSLSTLFQYCSHASHRRSSNGGQPPTIFTLSKSTHTHLPPHTHPTPTKQLLPLFRTSTQPSSLTLPLPPSTAPVALSPQPS